MTMRARSPRLQRRRQDGAVLFVSLVILLVLTSLALVMANTSILENKMVGAARNRQLAELAAGSALSEARHRISAIASTSGAASVCATVRCFVREPGWPERASELIRLPAVQAALNDFPVDFTKLDGANASARLAASPGYLVEDLGTRRLSPGDGAGSLREFRITAIGPGMVADSEFVIETVHDVQE